MATSQTDRFATLAAVAEDWQDPDHPPRAEAVEATLASDNRYTEEAVAYALNSTMQTLASPERLSRWLGERGNGQRGTVGLLASGAVPGDAIRDAVAVWGTGHVLMATLPDASPAILPAFAEAVADATDGDVEAAFVDEASLFERADAVIATPPADARAALVAQCEAHGIVPEDRHLRTPVYSVALIDGTEDHDVRQDLAEDMLLHEGLGRRRVAVVWAPVGDAPDDMLQSMAEFRGVFPAHPDTPGTLQMQQAFLEAQDASHAYAAGLEFLVSRGAPEAQAPAHVRWAEYESLDEVSEWLEAHAGDLYAVVARRGLQTHVPDGLYTRTPGAVHRPPLDDPDGAALAAWLTGA